MQLNMDFLDDNPAYPLWERACYEAKICWYFIRYDVLSTIIPATLFVLVALVATAVPASQWIGHVAVSVVYFWLYIYTFNLSNQYMGVEEDRINKPSRPIPSGMVSKRGTLQRWFAVSALFLAVGAWQGVFIWALSWLVAQMLYNYGHWSAHWFTKNVIMGVGVVVQLAAAWELVAPLTETVIMWISFFAIAIFIVIGLQDMRDVAGDRALNRNTLPIRFGDVNARRFLALTLAAIAPLFWGLFVRDTSLMWLAQAHIALILLICVVMAGMVYYLRHPKADHYTYSLLCVWYCIALFSGVWLLA